MSAPPKPATQKETLDQVWWVLIGSNGDGVVSKVNTIRVDLDKVLHAIPTLATKEELGATMEAHENRDMERRAKAIQERDKKSMSLREWLGVIGTVGAFVWPIVVFIFWKG